MVVAEDSAFKHGVNFYTQLTDVESEVTGLVTYDREVIKVDVDKVRQTATYMTGSSRIALLDMRRSPLLRAD